MIYKMGIKEWAAYVAPSVVMLLLVSCTALIAQNFKMAITYALICIFTLAVGIAITLVGNKLSEKKAELLRVEISKVRAIVCEGPASYKYREAINFKPGWMFLTEDAIEFYPRKMNNEVKSIPVLLNDIISVETKRNLLVVKTDTQSFNFSVVKPKAWKESIQKTL